MAELCLVMWSLDRDDSRISIIAAAGATIVIDDVSSADTILSIKRRVFALNRKLPVRRQRLVYRSGPCGMDPLADDETLGGAGVVRDGSAELDVLLATLTDEEAKKIGPKVRLCCCHADFNLARHELRP
jgi:hypothetical protein